MGNIPWMIIGIGDITGSTKYVFDFFYPASLNPLVLLFHGYNIVIGILGSYWICFGNGVAFLTKYKTFFYLGESKFAKNKITIRLLWTLMLFGGIFATIMMWKQGSTALRFTNT